MSERQHLDRLAGLAGIEPGYWDIWGNYYETSEETKRTILAALGLPAWDEALAETSLSTVEDEAWSRPLPPVSVVREGEALSVPLSLSTAAGDPIAWQVTEEGGRVHRGTVGRADLDGDGVRQVDGHTLERMRLDLNLDLPIGYHELRLDGAKEAMRLIVCPRRCHLPPGLADGGRQWGITTHLYTVRSERDWGIGDFTDLGDLAEQAASLGASTLGVNPLHSLFPQNPEHASPYSPSSRLFLNPVYLDVEAVPDWGKSDEARALMSSPEFAAELARVRALPFIDYTAVSRLKMQALERLHESFRRHHLEGKRKSARATAFRRFREEGGERLRRYAIFEALAEHLGEGGRWPQWPDAYKRPESKAVAAFAKRNPERVEFHEYLQWEADRQLGEAARRAADAGIEVGLYRDLAIGADPNGADAWSQQDVIVHRGRVGCPPDPFSLLGQDWGTPPPHPRAMRDQAYEPFIAILRANMRHAGALRIDHVMGLMHLFWIPAGELPKAGAYVEYPFEDLLGILALESRRHQCLVIGEDLGTVPDGFRERMAEANILSYRVLYFEKDGDRFKGPDEYPALALACVSTHDLPTLVGFWAGADLDLKKRLAQFPDDDAERGEREGRVHDRWLLLKALEAQGLLPDGADPDNVDGIGMTAELAGAVHRYLALSPASLLMVQIDDLTGEAEQINLPGTNTERPNWRRRLSRPLSALGEAPLLRILADALRERRPKAS